MKVNSKKTLKQKEKILEQKKEQIKTDFLFVLDEEDQEKFLNAEDKINDLIQDAIKQYNLTKKEEKNK